MSIENDVYGITFENAKKEMEDLREQIKNRSGCPFKDKASLEEWAMAHCLGTVVLSGGKFLCVSHKGEMMIPSAFESYYGSILTWEERLGNKIVTHKWHPEGFDFLDNALIASETGDGTHRPLYYRDYTVPTGYFNKSRRAFNRASPFPVFAKRTGRDTSHIYTYLEHIAGECYMWLLAWIRTKMVYPTVKTQIVPVIVSRTQGTGKSTFAEVICKGLFGKENVIVSDQYDATARFNADYADALIVCQEEKEEIDKRNPSGTLKSRSTATTIRKEQKGVDPVYQESYTDFIMTSNDDVPIRFDGPEDQRRFMVMEADNNFTRKTSVTADEVFSKLYGRNSNNDITGTPFVDDTELIQQFKHEIFSNMDIANVKLRDFPKTGAYKKCYSIPRAVDTVEVENIMRSLAPIVKESLLQKTVVMEVEGNRLDAIIEEAGAVQYIQEWKTHPAYIAICIPVAFTDARGDKISNSVVERAIFACGPWLLSNYGLAIIPDMEPLIGGFKNLSGRYRGAAAAKICKFEDFSKDPVGRGIEAKW